MLKKLRVKFILTNMGIVTLMIALAFGLVYHFTKENLETESISMMKTLAADPIGLGSPSESSDELRLPYFTVQIGPYGDVLATGGGYFDLSDEGVLLSILSEALDSEEDIGIIPAYNLRYYRTSSLSTQCLVFADMTSERATLKNLIKSCVLIGLLVLAVFLGVSFALARWAVKPVDAAWKQQRQFVSDASHELKTPLTVIMTNAELLQSPDYDEASRQRFLASILTMSQQMRSLVERLLELARADNGQSRIAFAPLDLSKLAENALLPFEPLLFEHELTLTSHIEAGIRVNGSEPLLQQLLDILLDNACKYADAPGRVHVALAPFGHGHCRLMVANTGKALSPEDCKAIFKRFYRADPARSRDGSFGLGLSIAESIAQQHRGKIWVESSDGSNRFFIELPML